jgi:hypothetical protein
MKLLGVQDARADFFCAKCATEKNVDVNDEKNTCIYDTDEWFQGEICAACERLIGGPVGELP